MAHVMAAAEVAKGTGNFVRKHKRGIGVAMAAGAIAAIFTIRGCEAEKPVVDVDRQLIIEDPKVSIKKIEGASLGCFAKQTTGVHLEAHDETNLSINTPSIGFGGFDIIPSYTPLDNVTLADRTSIKDRTLESWLCADNTKTEAVTTWKPVKDTQGNYIAKDPTKPRTALKDDEDLEKSDYVKVPGHLKVTIHGLDIIGGLVPDDSDVDKYEPAFVDRITPNFIENDNSNVHRILEGVAYGLGMQYSCNDKAIQVANEFADRTFEDFAYKIANIPKEEVEVDIVDMPKPNPNWAEGRADNNELKQKLSLKQEIPSNFRIDIGQTACGAVVTDNRGQVLTNL